MLSPTVLTQFSTTELLAMVSTKLYGDADLNEEEVNDLWDLLAEIERRRRSN